MSRIKYIQHPTFTAAEWATAGTGGNIITLGAGEIGFEKDEFGKVISYRVGPGKWTDLEPLEITYPYTAAPTNEIGDAKGSLLGKTPNEILNLMLNPYQASTVSGVTTNAGGSDANSTVLEVGTQLNGSLTLKYSVSNAFNLNGTTPINVLSSSDIFTNIPGNFANGNITLSLVGGLLKPTTLITYTISVKAAHLEGDSNTATAKINFYPKIQWGVGGSDLTSILTADLTPKILLSSQLTKITNNYAGNYNINGVGYTWFAIPSMLGANNPTFSDVTDPNAPAGYAMQFIDSAEIDTGVGIYEYQFYRSVYYLESTGILKVS